VRLPAALRALREREFRLLFVGQGLSLVGDGMVNVALPFAVLDLTGSVTDLGFVFAAFTLPLVAFLLVGGVFADRFEQRGVMVASDLTRFASQGLVAVLLVSGQARIWELVVLQAVRGAAVAFFMPASTALTPSTVPPELLQEANALRGISLAFGQVIGPAVGGFVVAGVGPGWAIGFDSVSYAVSAAFLVALRLPRREPLPPQPFLHDLLDGWREFTARTWVWSNLALIGVGNTVFNSTFVLGAAVAKRSLGGAGAWGLILGALGLGAVIGGVVALRIRPGRPLVTANLWLIPFALPPALLALRPPLAVIVVGAGVGGIGGTVFNAVWETALQRHIPPERLSRVTAYDWFVSTAANPLGQALSGPAAGAIGIDATLAVAAGWLAAAPFLTLAIPSIRSLTADGYESIEPRVADEVEAPPVGDDG
jgi:MFS family permease